MNVGELFTLLLAEVRGLRAVVESLAPARSTRLVDAGTVAAALSTSRAWVYEHADELGATRLGEGARPRLRFDLDAACAQFACLSSERSQPANGEQPRAISAGGDGGQPRRRRSTAARLPVTGSVLKVRPRSERDRG
jgi:hypothetical protein